MEKLKEAFDNLDAEFSKMLEIAIENFKRMEDFKDATIEDFYSVFSDLYRGGASLQRKMTEVYDLMKDVRKELE
jgi:hypothetical protein